MSLEVCTCGKEFLTEADPYLIIPSENYKLNCGCYYNSKRENLLEKLTIDVYKYTQNVEYDIVDIDVLCSILKENNIDNLINTKKYRYVPA